MSSSTQLKSFAAVVALGVVILLMLNWLPSRRSIETGAKSSLKVSASKLVALNPPEEPPYELANFRHEPQGIRFDVTFRASTKELILAHPLIFVIPERRSPRVRIEAYRIASDDTNTTETAAIQEAAIANRDVTDAVIARGLGIMRRWNLCSIDLKNGFFAPYNSLPSTLRGELRASLVIEWDEPFNQAPSAAKPDPQWEDVARVIAANTEGIKLYKIDAPALRSGIHAQPNAPWKTVSGERLWFRLRLREEGLYEVKMDEFILSGVPSSQARSDAVRVFRLGEPVRLLRVGEGPAQRVFFWHTANESPYTAEKTYFVTLDGLLPDERIEPISPSLVSGDPIGFLNPVREASLDRDHKIMIESGNFLAIKSMSWVDAPITKDVPLKIPLTFHSLARTTDSCVAELRFLHEPQGILPSFRLHLKKDNAVLATLLLRSTEDLTQTISLPTSAIGNAANEFTFELDNLPEMKNDDGRTTVWFDSIRISYPSQPDLDEHGRLTLTDSSVTTGMQTRWTPLADNLTLASAPALAIGPDGKPLGTIGLEHREGATGIHWPAGRGYRVEITDVEHAVGATGLEAVSVDDLTDAGGGSDLLIITHADFISEAARLAEHHRRDGLRVRIADIESVYDNFAGGDSTPHALRNCLGHMLETWGEMAPGKVLLLGDCSSDYRGVTRTRVKNFVPSFTYDAGMDDWASDYWFTAVTEDHLQDFMLARISVADREDAKAIVDKIIKYSTTPKRGAWRSRLAFVADDGGFVEPLEELRRAHTPASTMQEQIYLDENAPLEDNMYLPSKVVREKRMKVSPFLTAQIREAFNRGVAMIDYYGHGSPNIWMEERVWFGGDSANSDNQFLANSGNAAFVTTMTCNTGAIDYPVPKGLPGGGWNLCISEDMMRQPDGGAIALYVPSGPSVTGIQHQMSIELHRALFKDGVRALGPLQAISTTRFLARGPELDLVYMLIMLGDPAMKLQMAGRAREFALPKSAWLPGETIAFDLPATDLESGRYSGELRAEDGAILHQLSEQPFTNGYIPIQFKLPEDCENSTAVLSVYAWNENSDADLAASTELIIERPRIELRSVVGSLSSESREVIASVQNLSGVTGIARLTVHTPVDSSEPDAHAEATLAGGESLDIALSIPNSLPVESHCIEVRLNGSTATARRVILPPAEAAADIIEEASERRISDEGGSLEITARASTGPTEAGPFEIVITDVAGGVIHRADAIGLPGGGVESKISLGSSDFNRATSGTLLLVISGSDPVTSASALSSTKVVAIPLEQPHLAIVPSSVRLTPEQPFEGQTFWVDFEVENLGRATVPRYSVGLYDGPPELGSLVVPDHFRGTAQRTEGPLAPGERVGLSLRADPVDNAGEMTWVLRIDPQSSRGASMPTDLGLPIELNIRRKADLTRGATQMEEGESATVGKGFTLKGEVANEGGTDAHNVMVVFYAATARTPENLLGRILLPTVRAGEKLQAELPLDDEMMKKLKELGDLAAPNHQLVLNWRRSFGPDENPGRRKMIKP